MSTLTNNIAREEHSFGYINENNIYLNPFLHFPERKIGQVKNSNSDTFNYFEKRFDAFSKKVEELILLIDTNENKGSYLQKLLHLKESCGTYDALGNFEKLYTQLSNEEKKLHESIAKNRVKNQELKQSILEEIDLLNESSDWINTGSLIKELKNKWIRIGSAEKDIDDQLEKDFFDKLELFYQRRQVFFDERNAFNEIKLTKYKELATKAQILQYEADPKEAMLKFKKLQEQWREVGVVPKRDLESVMKSFKSVGESLNKKIKEQKFRKPQIELGAEVSGIDRLKAISQIIIDILQRLPPRGDDEMKGYQQEWKRIGYIRHQDFKELDTNFKRNCGKINDLYFMRKICAKRHEGFYKMPIKEQAVIQIGVIKELIERDSETLANFENNYNIQISNSSDPNADQLFAAKLNMQKRGLDTKKIILEELQMIL